jgi:uncharacterized protein (TIGR03084 family)
VLRAILDPLGQAKFARPTPAAGWSIADHVSHLAYFDEVAVTSATDADAFVALLARVHADGGVNPDTVAAQFRQLSGTQLREWFTRARGELLTVFAGLDPSARVPWFGPTMSVASSLTARLMETWAHGQDIADTVGAQREPTHRLRHVAHIGVGVRAFSYQAHGLQPPAEPVRVELRAPSGALWTWGPEEAANRGDRTGAGLLPAGHAAPAPRRHDRHRYRRHRGPVAEHRPVVRRTARPGPQTGPVRGPSRRRSRRAARRH